MPIFDDFDLDIQKVNGSRGGDSTPSERRESCDGGPSCMTTTLPTAASACICETDTCHTMCNQITCAGCTINLCGTLKICTME